MRSFLNTHFGQFIITLRWPLILLAMVGVIHHLTMLTLRLLRFICVEQSTSAPFARRSPCSRCSIGLALVLRGTCVHCGSQRHLSVGLCYQLAGFWWLISGQAYRGYLLGASASAFDRLAAWAYTLTTQYTPAGWRLWLKLPISIRNLRCAISHFWLLPVSNIRFCITRTVKFIFASWLA